MMVLFDAMTVVLPIICGVAGLLIGAAIILFVPFSRNKEPTKTPQRLLEMLKSKQNTLRKTHS